MKLLQKLTKKLERSGKDSTTSKEQSADTMKRLRTGIPEPENQEVTQYQLEQKFIDNLKTPLIENELSADLAFQYIVDCLKMRENHEYWSQIAGKVLFDYLREYGAGDYEIWAIADHLTTFSLHGEEFPFECETGTLQPTAG